MVHKSLIIEKYLPETIRQSVLFIQDIQKLKMI